MTFGTVASVIGVATGINSLTGGGVSQALGFGPGASTSQGQAQQMADPFSSYRANLASMYSGALQPGAPSNIQAMPGFSQFKTGVLDPAMQASQTKAASTGQLYSGAESAQLQGIGQQGYYGFMTDYMNRLAQGSGATNNPAQATGIGLAQGAANQQGFSQGLGAVATGLQSFAGQTNSMGNQVYNPVINNANSQYGMGVGSLLSGTGGIAD
jgi:hypothetical protein